MKYNEVQYAVKVINLNSGQSIFNHISLGTNCRFSIPESKFSDVGFFTMHKAMILLRTIQNYLCVRHDSYGCCVMS